MERLRWPRALEDSYRGVYSRKEEPSAKRRSAYRPAGCREKGAEQKNHMHFSPPRSNLLKGLSSTERESKTSSPLCLGNDSILCGSTLLSYFPRVDFAIAYGSGVFSQTTEPTLAAPPMLDFIFAVDNPSDWHASNLRLNPSHYSTLAILGGANRIARLQESKLGAGVWFNTLVPVPISALPGAPQFPQRLMKYGIVSMRALMDDLTQWDTLYVAGRMHKPIKHLCWPDSVDTSGVLDKAIEQNLHSALCAALLTLPSEFNSYQLYSAVTGLSYAGDWRMAFGEDPNKVNNIVVNNVSAFQNLYSPLLSKAPFSSLLSRVTNEPSRMEFSLDTSPKAISHLTLGLPLPIQKSLSASSSYPTKLSVHLSQIVAASSRGQGILGLISAGPVKALSYSAAKLVKAMKGKLRR